MSDPFDYLPADWSSFEKSLYEPFGDEVYNDRTAQALYHEAFFNFDARRGEITAIRDNLRNYLSYEYGVDLDNVFDWDAWREQYEGEGG